MFDKLEKSVERFEEVHRLMSDPVVIADQQRFRELGRELHKLEAVVKSYTSYKKTQRDFQGSKELLESTSDPEMKAMAQEEYDRSKIELGKLEEVQSSQRQEPDQAQQSAETEWE